MAMWWTIFFAATLTTSPVGKHDFHVSKAHLEYRADLQELQISMHIFIDDLESALAERGVDNLFICTQREAPNADDHIARYLEQKFRLSINGRPAACSYLGKEISDDMQAVWCYLLVADMPSLKTLSVEYRVLMEIFDDQKNIAQIIGPQQKKGLLLFEKGRAQDEINFNE